MEVFSTLEIAGPESKFAGNNILLLCRADVMAALEWYFNTVLLRAPVTVTGVRERQVDGVFEICIKPQEGESK